MINKIFQITNFLDIARWQYDFNYNLINYFSNDLTEDEKLLTHWICYITDRRTPFRRIWDVGGFVFSQLVQEMKKAKNLDLMNHNISENSYFIKKENNGYAFRSKVKAGKNSILIKEGFEENKFPEFLSRYYPADFKSILSTFDILKDKRFDINFTRYIIHALNLLKEEKDIIPKLLFALYLLTYYDIGKPSSADLSDFKILLDLVKKRTKNVKKILFELELFKEEYHNFKKNKIIFNQKRAWCALRDYIKSPEFKRYLFISLTNEGCKDFEFLKSEAILNQLELPGDVWNNSDKFKDCVFQSTPYHNLELKSPELLRKIYNENKVEKGYPEIFDITFDFVPRMCEVNNCSICPYGLLREKAFNFEKVCINNPKKYCPVVLVCCNYKIKCVGTGCELLSLSRL